MKSIKNLIDFCMGAFSSQVILLHRLYWVGWKSGKRKWS